MIIQANKKLTDLSGKELDITIGQAIANILVTDKMAGKMKAYILATRLYDGKDSESIDEADFKLIKDAVDRTDVYNSLVAGQLMAILSKINEKQD